MLGSESIVCTVATACERHSFNCTRLCMWGERVQCIPYTARVFACVCARCELHQNSGRLHFHWTSWTLRACFLQCTKENYTKTHIEMSSENQSGGNTNLKKQDLSQLVNICRFNFLIKNTFPIEWIDTLLIGLAEFVLVANLPISKATVIAGFK